MNGQERKYFNKMHSDLSHNMVELQARFEEKWDSHDKTSGERHTENTKRFDKIFDWLQELPCGERKWIGKAVYGVYGAIGILIVTVLVHVFLKN